MYVGKGDGAHRTYFLFQSFVVNCHVQKACHHQVANVHVICVAAWEWKPRPLCEVMFFHFSLFFML